MGIALPEYLQRRKVTKVILGGLAIDYCVGLTALDLKEKMDLDVIVAIDATKGITPNTTADMLDRFKDMGIKTASTKELLADIEGVN
jgi:nicotinamidase/pyrazinamidase